MMLKSLPSGLYKIVYKYIYDTVLNELKTSYGYTIRLRLVPITQSCTRIKEDSVISKCDNRKWYEKTYPSHQMYAHIRYSIYVRKRAMWASKGMSYDNK